MVQVLKEVMKHHKFCRAERRGNFAAVRPVMESHEDDSAFSFSMNNHAIGTNTGSNSNPFEIDVSRFSCNPTGAISSGTLNGQNDSSSSINHFEDDFDLKSEIQSVLEVNV